MTSEVSLPPQPDRRVEAAAKEIAETEGRVWRESTMAAPAWLLAENALAAADAVDPLRQETPLTSNDVNDWARRPRLTDDDVNTLVAQVRVRVFPQEQMAFDWLIAELRTARERETALTAALAGLIEFGDSEPEVARDYWIEARRVVESRRSE